AHCAIIKVSDLSMVLSVIGTALDDMITDNDGSDTLIGAGGLDSITAGSGNDVIAGNILQVVLLDFDSQTIHVNDHVYTSAERSAVLQGLRSDFSYFNYFFTDNPLEAQAMAAATGGKYATVFFNEPPPGGKSDQLDFRNVHLDGNVSVDVNPFIGLDQNQVAPTLTIDNQTVDTYVSLSVEIAAHEIGHQSGLRHGDAFGAIGTGMFHGINPSNIYPALPAPLPLTN